MIVVMSPAKSMRNSSTARNFEPQTFPSQSAKSVNLLMHLKQLPRAEIAKLMSVSTTIAEDNERRFKIMQIVRNDKEFAAEIGVSPAYNCCVDLYDGPAFRCLDFASFSPTEASYAQKHLRIISGLYG